MPEQTTESPLVRVIPGVFVLLWSTGFIGARLVLPHSEPFTFLALRFGCTVALLVPLALILKAKWPRDPRMIGHIAFAGVLVHAGYLGGVFSAIELGMPAGLAALIAGLQPILTAALAIPLLGERVSPRQWVGFLLGLVGVVTVLADKLAPQAESLFQGFGLGAVACAGIAVLAITISTLYQKRFCQGVNLTTASAIQFAAAAVAVLPFALVLETREIAWTGAFVAGLLWLVVVLSVGAVTLLMILIRRGAAGRVASLFYLVPPVTALVAWLMFDERLGPLALGGMGIAVTGVALVVLPKRESRRR
ncbi:MAG: DMT family transporter [Rhodospirillum sp.]|nr:DMT family transporter [Rhodospirillum sp.]MCF8489142.1 DMT family transporter [Rhodospirillum sp.]MCF8502393.1 DMT family transporter [Rhodospirillum sp.]